MSDKKQQAAYPLRMPPSLREAVEQAAHESKRSVNAEIISRLELSLAAEQRLTEFISAERARELSDIVERNLPKKLRDAFQAEIYSAAQGGAGGVVVSGQYLGLDPDVEAHEAIMSDVVRELREAGYGADRFSFYEIDITFYPEEAAE
ncbi:Arc family DNA-binding protein [Pseudomonas edaphica]|uniref:Arc family DNA-binding protein n=1 Tax=Pseudomonas edaphica TaxID=2006980 RepID=A0A7Y8E375_9PSED|nr:MULTISPECIES: Arc family DNA-binding protein [Pseudomonas]NWC48727.1 Arc family DNA-binding protein [Pseudomonas sp. IPO3747]NWE07175.1 Arc family DNA-binding protein [Pseudomonas edaphica]NWE81475.1 Arc family DNA-binding protein [Pseudomonas edaphica]PIB69526.1 hypothetical protein AOA62_03930 [Pseudomonas sp. 2995-3]